MIYFVSSLIISISRQVNVSVSNTFLQTLLSLPLHLQDPTFLSIVYSLGSVLGSPSQFLKLNQHKASLFPVMRFVKTVLS